MNDITLNAHNKEEFPPMHTTEHIVNRAMINLFGCGRAFEAHIERKKSKLDYRLDHCPTDNEVAALETEVNRVIDSHLDVTTEFITQSEALSRFDLSRLPGDYDECLCIGLHVGNTAEIGRFKIISHDWDADTKRWRLRFKLEERA